MTNGYVIERSPDGVVITADFKTHRRPPVPAAQGNHVHKVEFGRTEDLRKRAQDNMVIATLFAPDTEWREVSGALSLQAVYPVDLARLGISFNDLRNSVGRIFTRIGVAPRHIVVTPSGKNLAEVQVTAETFQQFLPAMEEAYQQSRSRRDGAAPSR